MLRREAKFLSVLLPCWLATLSTLGSASPVPRPSPVAGPAPNPFIGAGGYGFVEKVIAAPRVITPPVVPPVLNTVDVYDIATLGVIPAPPIEYIYPAVGYEAFGLGGGCRFGRDIPGFPLF